MSTPFEWPLRVYWEDTDAGGIVYYANYLKFLERARTEWLRSRGIEQAALRVASGGVFVVSEIALRYHASARLDDALVVSVLPGERGRASLTLQQSVHRSSIVGKTLLCEGRIRIGWVNADTGKPARIPSHLLEALT